MESMGVWDMTIAAKSKAIVESELEKQTSMPQTVKDVILAAAKRFPDDEGMLIETTGKDDGTVWIKIETLKII